MKFLLLYATTTVFLSSLPFLAEAETTNCGNNNVDPGEECDGEPFQYTCVNNPNRPYEFHGGKLQCIDCEWDYTLCEHCGDDHVNGVEQCDKGNLNSYTCLTVPNTNFASGKLGCKTDCTFDTSGCDLCGNDVIDRTDGEECDGELMNGMTCENIHSYPMVGALKCDRCRFDESGCSLCGNGQIDTDNGEDCDDGLLAGKTCQNLIPGRPMIGDLRCKNCHFDYDSCSLCGNNQIDTGEDCDGDKMGASASCLTVDDGAYIGGTLKCNVDACTFDTRDCVKPTCGDGVAQGLEECDEDDLRKERCETLNGKMTFYGGSLSCKKEDCTFDTSKCLTLCGNGVLDENLEQCDGEQLGGKTCTNLGAGILSFAGGVLRCDDYCHLDTSACYEPEATKTDSKKSTSCFSGETFIEVLNKGMVSMKHLSVGDKVFTGNNEFGTPLYQPVYSFGHLELDVPTEYIRIFHTKTGKKEPPIELSPSHLIFVAGAKDPIRADIVTTGDALVRVGAEAVLVTKVDKVLRKGAYLPLTPSGLIVVNGVAASTYVSIDDEAPDIVQQFGISQQNLFHWWLTPYRMTCMGLSSKVCQEDFAENGIIHWLNFGEKFAMYGQQQHWIIQKIGVTILSLFLLVFVASEAVFGPKYGLPGSLVIVLVVRYALKRSAKQE